MASLASAVSREGVTDVPETVAPPAAVQTDYEMSATTLDLTGAESPIASDCSAAGDSSADEAEIPEVSPPPTAPESLKKKLVLVTGGAGFIGSHVCEHLLNRGDDVVLVDEVNDYYDVRIKRNNLRRLRDGWGVDRLRIYEGDCADADFMADLWAAEMPRHVVHLAARAGVRPSIQDPFIYIHSNVDATTRLLELARTHGNDSFVFASSSSVYGGSKKSLFSETDVVDFPVSPYAATKKACELMAYTYHHLYGMNIAGLRFFTVYGPRGRPDMAPFKFVDRVSRGLEIQQFGDGSSSRDYTFIDDIVSGVVLSLDKPQGYQIYNLGNGNPVGLKDFISIVEGATGKTALIKVMPDQPGDVPRTAADISKARELLGYEPRVSFKDGIERLAAWYRDEYAVMGEEPETFGVGKTQDTITMSKSTSMVSMALGSHGEAGCL